MQAGVQQPSVTNHHTSTSSVTNHHEGASRPATTREAAMDLIDLANLKVFGNMHFRPKQREIITAALQVAE